MENKTASVPNISCGHCVNTIERELRMLDGVETVEASFETREVTVAWDPSKTDWATLADRLEQIHYPATD